MSLSIQGYNKWPNDKSNNFMVVNAGNDIIEMI